MKSPKVASRLALYTLAKELNISPAEAYQLPSSLIMELLCVHQEVESYKSSEMERMTR